LLCLCLSVAEIRLRNDARDEEWIDHIASILRQKYEIFRLYKSYYRKSII
jgi:hypothetical protein